MRRFNANLLVSGLILAASFMLIANPVPSSAAVNPVAEAGSAQSPLRQETQSFVWPDIGLALSYPTNWVVTGDQNFEFVLLGPETESGEGLLFIGLQSADLAADETAAERMVRLVGEEAADTISEISLGDLPAWQYEEVGDQHIVVIGFESASRQISILLLTAPEAIWDTWEPVFDAMLASVQITPLDIDTDLLNQQLQASLEADNSLTVGDPDAPVSVVEFMDFSCPHCVDYRHSIERLVQDYVVPGKVRLTISVMTFVGGGLSVEAAQAMYCGATLGVGWDMHDLLFNEYLDLGAQAAYTRDHILEAVNEAELGIDMAAFETCLDDEAVAAWLEENSQWATELEVGGTPTVFVGTSPDTLVLQEGRLLYYLYPSLDELLGSEEAQ